RHVRRPFRDPLDGQRRSTDLTRPIKRRSSEPDQLSRATREQSAHLHRTLFTRSELDQLRGTSDQGTSRSTRTSPGRPSTRSPRMFFITSVVPPSIELARLRRNAFWSVSEPIAVSGRIIS